MKTVLSTCPACGERGKVDAGLIGQSVSCAVCDRQFVAVQPQTRIPRAAGFIYVGILVAIIGAALATHLDSGELHLITLGGIAMGVYGVSIMAQELDFSARKHGAKLLLLVGLLVLVAGFIFQSLFTLFAGGFVAVVGAILMLKK